MAMGVTISESIAPALPTLGPKVEGAGSGLSPGSGLPPGVSGAWVWGGGVAGGEVWGEAAVGVEEAVGEVDAEDDEGVDLADAAVGEGGMKVAGEGDDAFIAGLSTDGHRYIFKEWRGVEEGDEARDLGEEFAGEEEGPEVFAPKFGFIVTGDAGGFGVGMEDDAIGGEVENEAGEPAVKFGENIGRG